MSERRTVTVRQGREPELEAADANVVVDVLRAFTTTHVALEAGCTEVLLAETVDEAFELYDAHPDYILAGERDARRLEGFDLGNSPFRARDAGLGGRGLILTTTNGVRATMHALRAEHVLVSGWSNAPATIAYLRRRPSLADGVMQIVASHPVSDEDVACAEYIAGHLTEASDPPTPSEVVDRVRSARSAQKFYGSEFLLRDLDLACRQQPSNYAMLVERIRATPRITRAPIAPAD